MTPLTAQRANHTSGHAPVCLKAKFPSQDHIIKTEKMTLLQEKRIKEILVHSPLFSCICLHVPINKLTINNTVTGIMIQY